MADLGEGPGGRPPLLFCPLFCVSKKEMTGGRKTSRASKSKLRPPPLLTQGLDSPLITVSFKVHLTPNYFFRSSESLHLFKTHCSFLPRFNPNPDLLQAVKVTKSGHHLSHHRASKGYCSIPGLTLQTSLHACLQDLI